MSRGKRYLLAGCALVLALVGGELGLRQLLAPVASVQVINAGREAIEGLRVESGQSQAGVHRIEPGESARLHIRGRGPSTLRLSYQQRGSALTNFEVPNFDPPALAREGFMLVLRVRENEYERYQDEDEPSTLSRLGSTLKRWLEDSLKSE